MRHFCLTILLLLSVLSLPSYAVDPPKEEHKKDIEPALGKDENFGRWTGPVNLVYDPDGASDIFSDEEFLDILKEAIGRWELVSGIKFNITGMNSEALDDRNLDRTNRDGLIRVYWLEECECGARAGPLYDSYDLDLGYYPYYDGTLAINASSNWTSGSLVNAIEHELGHLIGLGHSDDSTSIMYANPYNNLAYPRIDDILAVQALYGPPAVAIDPTKPLSQWTYTPPPQANSSVTKYLFKANQFTDEDAYLSYRENGDEQKISNVNDSTPDEASITFNPGGIGNWETTTDINLQLTLVLVDPFGYVVKEINRDHSCKAEYACSGGYTSFTRAKRMKSYPGDWKLYVIEITNPASPATLLEMTIPVETTVSRNMPPSATLDVTAGSGNRSAVFSLKINDAENDDVSITWNIPGLRQDADGDGYYDTGITDYNVPNGSKSRAITFPSTGKYSIFIEVNDNGSRYDRDETASGYSYAGKGFQTLLRVDLTLPVTPFNVVVTSSYKDPAFEKIEDANSEVVPEIPQQSLSRITRTDGTATDSTISIGASSDGGETTDTTFTVDDDVTLTAKIYPDSGDVGEEGELYVVMRSTIDGKKTFSALNEDGNWEAWNASLKLLPSAKIVASLQEVEDVLVYSGAITAGDRLFYVGYSLFTEDGKPVITTSLSPYKITVSE